MNRSWMMIAIAPLLAHADLVEEAEKLVAGRWEWVEEFVDQDDGADDVSLAEFFAEPSASQEEESEQQVQEEFIVEQKPRASQPQPKKKQQVAKPATRPSRPATPAPITQADSPNELQEPRAIKPARPVKRASPYQRKAISAGQKPPQPAPKAKSSKRVEPPVAYTPKAAISDNYSDMPSSSARVQQQKNAPQEAEPNTWNGHRKAIDTTTIYLDGQYLWWQANENGLDFAISKDFSVSEHNTSGGLAGDMHRAKYNWTSGFRLDGGYRFDFDAWEAFADYTWLCHDNQHDRVTLPAGANSDLVGTFPQVFSGPVLKAISEVNLHYQVANLSVARRFEVSKNILFRVYAGPRGAWINRTWNVTYDGTGFNSSKTKSHWGYKGYGIQLGLDTQWYFGYGFNIYAQGAIAALHGHHHDFIKTKSTVDPLDYFQKSQLKDFRSVQATQLSMGLAWGETWGEWGLKIFAGWEFNSWYNLAEHYRTITDNSVSTSPTNEKDRNLTSSTFSTQGLNLGVTLEF